MVLAVMGVTAGPPVLEGLPRAGVLGWDPPDPARLPGPFLLPFSLGCSSWRSWTRSRAGPWRWVLAGAEPWQELAPAAGEDG